MDNQQYVIMCSPARDTSAEYVAYGHSLVMDPWGEIVATAKEEEAVITADIDLGKIAEVRKKLPVLNGLRSDLYTQSWKQL